MSSDLVDLLRLATAGRQSDGVTPSRFSQVSSQARAYAASPVHPNLAHSIWANPEADRYI